MALPVENSFDVANSKNFEDMCQMDTLNEPEVLANLTKRYLKDQIFTSIGPTLISINPYRHIDLLFGKDKL